MNAYQVHLEIFEGPLDLLLFLIKKNDLDITDIPIAQITQEYLELLDLMKELNLEVAGEFLVMASTLMQIKSHMLLPSPEAEEEEGPDPRAELVSKLLEYQKYKQAAQFLDSRSASGYKDIFYRGSPRFNEEDKTLDLDLFGLLGALRKVLSRLPDTKELEAEAFPVEDRIRKILYLLESRPSIALEELFRDETRRGGVISCFLALLELVKLQKIFARQSGLFGEVRIFKKTELPEEIKNGTESN
ncbi:MAG: segregation/condensation protein A [Elusimicrobia bacterium]|nr:segregation/condensation protein A [Elusimicrobiota bacterium]